MAVEMAAIKSTVTATLHADPKCATPPPVDRSPAKSAPGTTAGSAIQDSDSTVSGGKWLRSVLANKRQRRRILLLHDDDSALGCISPDEFVTFQLQHQSDRIKTFVAPLTFTLSGVQLIITILMGAVTVSVPFQLFPVQ
jgi:hypothetical protein